MWASRGFSQMLDTSQQNVNVYLPPEKKVKKSTESNFLKEALECCRNHEMGIEEASLIYGIPKKTLRAKLKDSNVSVIDENYRVFVLSLYPAEAESDLVAYLQDCIASQIILTTTEVRRLAYELVCEKYKVTSLPREKNCILGKRWYKKFIEKYPHLDMKNQTLKINEEKSANFYNTLESFINKYNITDTQIYSVGGIDLKFRASSIEDIKVIHKRRTLYTSAKAICCTNPIGDFVPPVFLKPHTENNLVLKKNKLIEYGLDFREESDKNLRVNENCDKLKQLYNFSIKSIPNSEDFMNVKKQIKMLLNKKLQPMSEENKEELREKLYEHFVQFQNKIISKSENSLNEITLEIFYNWFLGFLNYVKPNPQQRVLLLLSEQSYIKSFKILDLGKKNGIVFLVLPPHSVHKIYPLDGFAMSLNRNLSTCARRWLGKNPDFKTQHIPLDALFMEAFRDTVNPLIAKNGFLFSGIWPINRNIFESSELGGESILMLNKSKLVINDSCTIASEIKRNNLSLAGIRNESDLNKLCRVCMKEKMYMKPLFEMLSSPVPNYHGKKISEIVKMPISHEDGLPSSLCQYCLVQLMDTIKIRETAVESHNKQIKLRQAADRLYFEDQESENQEFLCLFQYVTAQINDPKIINRVLSKNFDVNSICRICMGEKPLMTSIFFRSQGGTILCSDTCSRIMRVTHCQVHIHDGLSSSICPFCQAAINKASEFIQRALNSDKILREIIAHFRINN